MKKIFLGTSFSGQVDPVTNKVMPGFRAAIEEILKSLRGDGGVEVFCAVEDEGWQLSPALPEVAVQRDREYLDKSDVLLALVDEKISAGLQFEMGYCVGQGKQVILAVKSGTPLAYYNQGVVSGGLVTLVTYDSPAALKAQLPIAVNAPPEG